MFTQKLSALLLVLILSACATSPTGRNQFIMMPAAQVDNMGLQAFETLKRQKAISQNAQYNRLAQCIAYSLTREVGGGQWEVVVFNDKSPNAFALPGNKIGIHTGLITLVTNADQLAAVVGHEIGHVIAKHSNERASQEMMMNQGLSVVQAVAGAPTSALGQLGFGLLGLGAQYGVLMPYGRTQESEADIIGVDLMARAGFDPRQSINLWLLMDKASQGRQPVEFMSTHPSHATRIQDLEQHMPQAMGLYQQAQGMGKRPQCA
jgi:predicted Zn-dependent protease